MKVSGGSVALWTPGASVSRAPGVVVGGRWPGRVVRSGGMVMSGVGVGGALDATGRSATGGWSGALAFFT